MTKELTKVEAVIAKAITESQYFMDPKSEARNIINALSASGCVIVPREALASIASNEIAEAMDAINTVHATLLHRQQPQDATFHRGQKALRGADNKIRAALSDKEG
jgi:hypothetical protein